MQSLKFTNALPRRQLCGEPTVLCRSIRRLAAHAKADRPAFWQAVPVWKNVDEAEFLSYKWQANNNVQTVQQLTNFLETTLRERVPATDDYQHRDDDGFVDRSTIIEDFHEGARAAPMSIRLTPYILSRIQWDSPLKDPIFRQFIPLRSRMVPDHPNSGIDTLSETADSPVKGLVHRYNDKALFLATSVCPVYCRFCTRSYSIGGDTQTVSKTRFLPIQKKWEPIFKYIEETPRLTDIVVSGGDSYTLSPEQISFIGDRLLSIPHIRRMRFASKGVAICPSKVLDEDDGWSTALMELSARARAKGKSVALHTHFNHPHEISWITELAAQKLYQGGLVVRNQSVLLRGVNNNVETMTALIRRLADMNIQPYYVYQGDMVRGTEDLRTPLHEILNLEAHVRGSIAGFMTPTFVVDLPNGGGKRLAHSYDSYDQNTGVAKYYAPSVKGGQQEYFYYDPLS